MSNVRSQCSSETVDRCARRARPVELRAVELGAIDAAAGVAGSIANIPPPLAG